MEREHRDALQALPVITFTATERGDIDWVSDRWYAQTGIERDAALGEAWVHLIHPDDVEHVVWLWTRALDAGTPWEATPRLRHADGTYHWWYTRAERVQAGDSGAYWLGTTIELSPVALNAVIRMSRESDDADGPRG